MSSRKTPPHGARIKLRAILGGMLLIALAGIPAWAQDVGLNPEVTSTFTADIVGLAKQGLDVKLPVDASFSLGGADIDFETDANAVTSETRLDTVATLYGEVAALPPSALKGTLKQSLDQVDAAIDAIRNAGSGVSIDKLYDELRIIENELDDNFVDPVGDSVNLAPISKARLLVIAEPIEQRYDYLKYITYKIKRYARNEVKDELAALLRRIVLDLADGASAAYRTHLTELLANVDKYRGTMIKEKEADRIRYKADSLLCKIAKNGVAKECAVDLSATIAGIDCEGRR